MSAKEQDALLEMINHHGLEQVMKQWKRHQRELEHARSLGGL